MSTKTIATTDGILIQISFVVLFGATRHIQKIVLGIANLFTPSYLIFQSV